ncbi:hypothetical protein OCL06_15260 [Alteromonas sp. ASW11-19]|uniref:DUF8198 domain-containing protein n=1 Tax=Alteromonas salexigens TaxID=2982530 RepID=A0ABT2VSN3_9ALTE|nr:hypothetical protein [Alteromonas salexigens]MCU7555947.1 hypothetical protein [Alteromonas salexigens]
MSQAIIAHLHQVNAHRDMAEKLGLIDKIHQIQAWQCERLLATHEDLARQQRYRLAMAFFVDELYGPKDFSQRDADLARVIPKLAKVLPDSAMQALDDALALNALSFDLDMQMAQQLDGAPLNRETYALAYRQVGRQADRQHQIDIIAHLGQQLADVVNIRGIGMLIKLARRPAKLAGLLTLHEFLQQGFAAFKALGDVHSFVDPVIRRERILMEQLLDPERDITKDNPLPHV